MKENRRTEEQQQKMYTRRNVLAGTAGLAAAGLMMTPRRAEADLASDFAALSARVRNLGVNIKEYGAVGDNVANDTAAFQAAINAASNAASGQGGIVFIPPGVYRITGTLTQPGNVQVIGSGTRSTHIRHSGSGPCFESLGVEMEGQRGWRGFQIYGNGTAGAKGIRFGDTWGAILEDLQVRNYTGGTAIELFNEDYWTEGSQFRNVMVRNSAVCVGFVKSAIGHESFSDTRFHHTTIVTSSPGQIALKVGPGVHIYGSTFDMKLHIEANNNVAMDVAGSATIRQSLFNIGIEDAMPSQGLTQVGLRTASGARVEGSGEIFTLWERNIHSVHPDSRVYLGPAHNQLLPQQKSGPQANWRNTGNAAEFWHPFQFLAGRRNGYGTLGVAHGNNIQSPFVAMYANPGNAFEVRRVPFDGNVASGSPVAAVEAQGAVLRLGGPTAPGIFVGRGSPAGVVAAPVGSTYHRTDGGAGTSFYVKQSGTDTSGWAAK